MKITLRKNVLSQSFLTLKNFLKYIKKHFYLISKGRGDANTGQCVEGCGIKLHHYDAMCLMIVNCAKEPQAFT